MNFYLLVDATEVDGQAELVVLHHGARDDCHLLHQKVVDLADHRQELARRLAQH
jgi:hypothetical protein